MRFRPEAFLYIFSTLSIHPYVMHTSASGTIPPCRHPFVKLLIWNENTSTVAAKVDLGFAILNTHVMRDQTAEDPSQTE